MKLNHVYFDLDGVFADLDSAMNKMFYGEYRKGHDGFMGQGAFFKHLKVFAALNGFEKNPVTRCATQLTYLMKDLLQQGIAVSILSSAGDFADNPCDVMRQKILWIEENIFSVLAQCSNKGFDRKISICFTTSGAGKAAFGGPGKLLVDDYDRNVEGFVAAGGVGFLFDAEAHNVMDHLRRTIEILRAE